MGLIACGYAPQAYADSKLTLSDGVNSITCTVSGGCTTSGSALLSTSITIPGEIQVNGVVGVFAVNVTTGLSKPILGFPELMELNSVNVNSGGVGTIEITWSDQGGTALLPFVLGAGGFLPSGGGATYSAYLDNSNALGALTTPIGTLGPFGPGGFSGNLASVTVPVGTPYSLTQVLTFSFNGRGTASGDFTLSAVPEPATITLLGGGLLAFAAFLRSRVAA